jgi:hypothetical protein
MPSSVKELEYTREFNSVLTHNLILAVLRNRLSAPQDVLEWLDNQPSLPVKQPASHHP